MKCSFAACDDPAEPCGDLGNLCAAHKAHMDELTRRSEEHNRRYQEAKAAKIAEMRRSSGEAGVTAFLAGIEFAGKWSWTMEKPQMDKLFRDDPATPEGKYLVKRRDGSVVEWPSFVLGARDPHAPAALRAYADSIEKDPDCHPTYPARLRKLADEFDEYRAAHGTGDPTRGRHRKDDPVTVAEMRQGRSA